MQVGSLGVIHLGGSRPRGLLHQLLHMIFVEVFVGRNVGEVVVCYQHPCCVVHCFVRIKNVGRVGG